MTNSEMMTQVKPGTMFKGGTGLKYQAVRLEENGIGQMMVAARVVKKDGSIGSTLKFFLSIGVKEVLS